MKRELKNWIFSWDDENKVLTITDKRNGSESNFIQIDKAHLYSLNSFLTRVWRRLSSKRRKI